MKRIILTGGGTAGHVTPNIALLPRLKELGYDIQYIGSYTGIETIAIGDKQVKFRSSATIPRLYRAKFKRDIFKDLSRLESSYKGNSDDGSSFEIEDLEIFENVAYIMAYHADHSIPATIEEWLDEFEMFSIYEVLPEILELWGMNLQTEIESKKNFIAVAGK